MGDKIGRSLNEYTQLLISTEKIRLERIQQKKQRHSAHSSKPLNYSEL